MKKRIIFIILIVLGLSLTTGIIYYKVTKEDKKTSLNLLEKQWIDKNKNNIIDVALINNIPIFNYDGNGIFFDFLNDLEKTTGLVLNKVSMQNETDLEYSFRITDEIGPKDILLYKDEYVIASKDINKKEQIIGVLTKDLERLGTYYKNESSTFKPYDDLETLFADLLDEEINIDAVALPKTIYLDQIINKNLNIIYNVSEMNKNVVLTLGSNERLNSILKKYYKKWSLEKFQSKYNYHLANSYFDYNEIEEKEKVDFKSRSYKYGFVENAPYDTLINNKLKGYNSEFLKQFSKIANIEINYKSYKNLILLLQDFNSNKLDIILNDHNTKNYDMDVYNSVPIYNNHLVVVSHVQNDIVVNSLKSLQNLELITIKRNVLTNVLEQNQLSSKTYDNINELLKNITTDSILVLDLNTYKYFSNKELKSYQINYIEKLNHNYNFVSRDIKDNKIFNNFFNFYLSFVNKKHVQNIGYYSLFNIDKKPFIIKTLILIISLILITGLLITLIVVLKKNKNKIKTVITKEDKLKYIDMLTSLKNRNYLNENIEIWDES